jgi:carbon storage regulator
MLILTRRAGESFFIGENIEVIVFETGTDRIRIGINAPAEIPIVRKEIKETQKENIQASNATTETVKDLNQYLKSVHKNVP